MNWLDISIIAFILIGLLIGVKDGILKQVTSLGGMILGFFFAFKFFRFGTRPLIEHWNISPALAVVVSFAFIVIIVNIVIQIIFYFIKGKDGDVSIISRILGGIIGAIQSTIVLSFMLLGLSFFRFPSDEIKSASKCYSSILHIAPMLLDSGSEFTIPIEEETEQEKPPTSL